MSSLYLLAQPVAMDIDVAKTGIELETIPDEKADGL